MNVCEKDVKEYVERFLNTIYNEKIYIDIQDDYYVVNREKRYKIYDFWNKKDEELLYDFNKHSFKADYIGTIFFFLSGYWEYTHNDIKDNYKRFSGKESFGFKKGILEEPVVDILVNGISRELNICNKESFRKPKILLTHDIDQLGMLQYFKLIKSIGGDILKRKDFKMVIDKIIKKITNKDPYSVSHLIAIHKKYNTKGTFFFMPDIQLKKTVGGYKPLKEKQSLKKMKDEILNSGSSIGIHYDARHLQEDRMEKDITVLEEVFEQKIESGRAHFLIFDISKSFDLYEKSGIKVDTTGSYADIVGFRFGTSYPYRPFNFREKREYNLIEIPLLVMDATLQGKRFMNLSPEEGFEKVKKIMDRIKLYNGVFTILWHNTSFYTSEWKDWEWVYEKILKYGYEKGFDFINSNEIT